MARLNKRILVVKCSLLFIGYFQNVFVNGVPVVIDYLSSEVVDSL